MRALLPERAKQGLLAFLAATASAQDVEGIPKLAPPYPELPPTFWEEHGGIILGSGIFLLAIVGLGVWLGLRKKPVENVPPATQARNELKALLELPEDGAVLSKVSQALRHYFLAAGSLPPAEFTTAEFCRLISGNEQIGAELASVVAEFLEDCDARKFSTATVSQSGAVARALDLVERSEAHHRPAPTAKA